MNEANNSQDTVFDFDPPSKEQYLQQQEEIRRELLESYIYSYYSRDKQGQDAQNEIAFRTQLEGLGVSDLSQRLMRQFGEMLGGKSLGDAANDLIAGLPEINPEIMPKAAIERSIIKLLKIGVRFNWKEKCVAEGQAAFAEGRNPVWPELPSFG